MTNAIASLASSTLSMSSKEIADYTGKRPADVLRDIRNMLADLELDERSFASVYLAGNGEQRPMYCLPKDLTLTLVSGYSAPMRHKIVCRWLDVHFAVLALT